MQSECHKGPTLNNAMRVSKQRPELYKIYEVSKYYREYASKQK